MNVGDLDAFSRFIRICAGRNGQLLNLSGLASDCGITHSTARRWISVLEASFILHLPRPHHENFGKRLMKSPKIYFLDTGLLCHLLGIWKADDLHHHAARGPVFESFVLSELQKNFTHRGEPSPLHYWRDSAGHEVDFLLDLGGELIPVEAKSAQTLASDFFNDLRYYDSLSGDRKGGAALIYGGDRSSRRRGVMVHPWFAL